MEQSAKKPSVLMMLSAVLMSVFAAVSPPLLAVAPGFFCHLLYTGGIRRFLLACAASSAFAAVLFGRGALVSQMCVVIVAVLICSMMKKRAAYFDTALFAAGVITLILYLMTSAEDLLLGAPPFNTVRTVFDDMWAQTMALMHASQGAFTDAQLSAYEQAGRDIAVMLPTYMPAAICVSGALFGLCNVAVMMRLGYKANADIKPASPFHMWSVPQSFVTGAVIMSLGSLVLPHIGVTSDAVVPAVSVVVMLPFMVQGFCLIRFLLRMRRNPSLLFALFLILTIVTFPTSALALAVLGLIEQMFRIRKRMHGGTTT